MILVEKNTQINEQTQNQCANYARDNVLFSGEMYTSGTVGTAGSEKSRSEFLKPP